MRLFIGIGGNTMDEAGAIAKSRLVVKTAREGVGSARRARPPT